MEKNAGRIIGFIICFFIGIGFTFYVEPTLTFGYELLFGFEVQSMASFPYEHRARLYSRPGVGDQTFTLEVDEKIVWVSGDAAPGNLQERLIWDKTGHVVTLELLHEKMVVYDAENRIVKYRRY